MKHLACSLAALALAATPALAETLSIEPGQWTQSTDVTLTLEQNGQKMAMPPQTQETAQCITEENATFDPKSVVSEGCTVENVSQEGRSMSFDMVCNQQGMQMNGDMQLTVSADGQSMSGEMAMSGSQPGVGNMSVSGTFSGKRTGACS